LFINVNILFALINNPFESFWFPGRRMDLVGLVPKNNEPSSVAEYKMTGSYHILFEKY